MGSEAPVTEDPLRDRYWNLPVSQLCVLAEPAMLTDAEEERHRIYACLLMEVVYQYWNGFKKGRAGQYPWNHIPAQGDPAYLDRDYLGHNIAAIAVDAFGRVLDFDFNHNTLFNSSAEHAEARLVRRLYSLAQLSESWSAVPQARKALGNDAPAGGYTGLSNVTVYTSLESCSQCSGIMALAQVREVVDLQTDPGMYFIGRILRNLTTSKLRSPLPISGGEIGLEFFETLNAAFTRFSGEVADKPFWISVDGKRDSAPSVTSFLCTSDARDIFRLGGERLQRLVSGVDLVSHPTFRPHEDALTNAQVVSEAENFRSYALGSGQRGTPHSL
jgi:tRNA(Arg) A34 adenosine deaminase TadA